MKKTILTLIASFALINFCSAQWTQNGSVLTTTNSVGIGTTAPADLLDIYGSNPILRITDNAQGNTSFFQELSNTYGGGFRLYDGTTYSMWFQGGHVGIGTTTPQSALDVNGAISMQTYGHISTQRNNNNNYTNLFLGGGIKDNGDGTCTVFGDGGSNYFAAIRMDNSGGNVGAINFYSGATTGGSNYTLSNAGLSNDLTMSLVGGNVAIGTSDPKGYKLAVNGSAIATAIYVKSFNSWPDYVFKPSYKLPSLTDIKRYIDLNHRLPDMPSAEEVAKDGINLGETDKLLTKKIEELTLYLIDKDNQLNEEKTLIGQQQQEIVDLKKEMEELKNAVLNKN